jgi:two-component system CheB/CheR fusion protein
MANSLKFTEKGNVAIGLNLEDGYFRFYVRDTGIGIMEEVKKYVFEAFMQEDFSSTRMYEGSGLGLSIVKGIVTLLGGEISLHSVKGEGTTFYFTIPLGTV